MKQVTVAIVGVGLIGGSLGLAWRQQGAARVIGIERDKQSLDKALTYGAIDEGTLDLAAGVAAANIVVLCTPVAEIVPTAQRVARHVRPGTLITDVGSTKSWIMEEIEAAWPPDVYFIGGHPLAGSEQAGVEAADPYLFANAIYCLTVWQPLPPAVIDPLLALIDALGATPLVLTPDDHDLVMAGVSHVPHLVAAALVNTVAGLDSPQQPYLSLAASGFRDTTRVAGGAADLWRDICLSNRAAILRLLEQFSDALHRLQQSIAVSQGEQLVELLEQARRTRLAMPINSRGHELVVGLVDRPGSIAQVTGILAAAQLNIVDLGILRVREGEGGTLRITLSGPGEVDRAVSLLQNHGYTARRRA